MKVRYGFVTNSSSSSFIIALNSIDDVDVTVKNAIESCGDELTNKDKEFAYDMMNRAIKESHISVQELDTILSDELERIAMWKFYYNTNEFWKNRDYLESDEYKKKSEDFINKRKSEIMKEIEGKSFLANPSFSDEDGSIGSALEHQIVPYAEGTICTFNHH